MTLKQHRQQAAQNGHTGREPADLTPRLPDDFPNESKRNPTNSAPQYPKTADERTRPADSANAGIHHRCQRSRPVPP